MGCREDLFFTEDVAHAADLGSNATEFFFEALVTTIKVIDAVQDGLSVGHKCGENERGGSAEVRAHDGGGLKRGLAADGSVAALHRDVGPHAVELANVHETIFKDVLGNRGGAFGLGGEGHVLGLHVGGEAGIFLGGDVGGLERSVSGADADGLLAYVEADAAFFKFGDQGSEVSGFAGVDVEIAAGDGSRDEEGPGFDAVGVDAMTGSMKTGDALNADGRGSSAFDLCTHGYEQSGEVGDLGLARAVLEEGFAVSEDGGHEEVFGAGDGDFVEDNVGAFEAVGFGFEIAVIVSDGGTHGFESLDVEINGAPPDGAASGHSNTSHASACDKWTKDERAGSHGLDDLVLRDGIGEDAAFDAGAVLGATVAELNFGTHGGEELALGLDVADLRDVFKDDLVFGEDGGGHAGKSGVFGSGDFDGSEKGVSAAYNELIHLSSLRKSHEEMGAEIGTEKNEAADERRLHT